MRSIEKQLNLSLSISLMVIFVVFWLISVFSIHHLTDNYVVTRLHHDNDSIIEHLQASPNHLDIDLYNLNPIYSRVHSGHYFVVKLGNTELTSPSLKGYPMYLKPVDQNVEVYESLGPASQTVLIRAQKATVDGQTVQIYVAEDHSPIQRTIRIFDMIIAVLTILSLITLYLLQRHLLQKGFNRLEPINRALKALHEGKAVKLDEKDYPSEVMPLIQSLNQAIHSATSQLEKSRQSNANLAHSLKTPLNIIYQLTERPELNDHPELKQNINEQAEKILRLIERELKGARLASELVAISPFSLNQDLPDLIKSFHQLYPTIKLTVERDAHLASSLPIEKEDGYELLGNLLDNACKYANRQVFLTLCVKPQGIQILIEDDGHGVSEADIALIQNRGFRLDESQPGHGIGLSIVKQIISAYQSQIEFSTSRLGGLQVKLLLKK